MDSVPLIFALVLFGLGLWILVDDVRFRKRARRAMATVLSTERVETRVNDTDARGRYRPRTHVAWKTRFRFRVDGRDYENEGEFDHEPAPVVPIWYDHRNPLKARTFKSKAYFGWTLLLTALIPFGFWLIDIGVIPLPEQLRR